MTPEQRILLTKIKYNYVDHIPQSNDAHEHFGHYGKQWHLYYKKAKSLYWYHQNLKGFTPGIEFSYETHANKVPIFNDELEQDLFISFNCLMRKKYYTKI